MAIFDYSIEAELSPTAGEVGLLPARRVRMRQPTGYGRFARAADAIRFAIEELPPEHLLAAQLKVAEERFDGDGIRRLYESIKYPLARHAVSRWRMGQVKCFIRAQGGTNEVSSTARPRRRQAYRG
jgi:hypothetical protein